jgi:hypothetical protein
MTFRGTFAMSLLSAVLVTIAREPFHAQEKPATVKGYVLDSACAFIKNLKKPISEECALACAEAGSPLVILADDGNIYWPISDSMPATGQNPRLMRFAGQRITASGGVFERGGSRALVIAQIEPASAGK